MSPLLPVAVYGLEVPAGEVLVPAEIEFPATVYCCLYHCIAPLR